MREIILRELKQELQDLIGFSSVIKDVQRGIYLFDDLKIKPVICITATKDTITNNMGDNMIRMLHVFIYGYSHNLDSIHILAAEVETFLNNTYSRSQEVIMGDLELIEGKSLNKEALIQQSLFTLEIKIKYDFIK